MEKENNDAAVARIFNGSSFPFISIGSTIASCAGAACVEHSSGVFRDEAPVNVRVFLHYFRYTIRQCAPHKNGKYLIAGGEVVRNRYQVVTCLLDVY